MSDSYLLDAGWIFFAAWGVVVLLVSWTAFRRDLFPVGSAIISTLESAAGPRKGESGADSAPMQFPQFFRSYD